MGKYKNEYTVIDKATVRIDIYSDTHGFKSVYIDFDDFEAVSKHNWCVSLATNKLYAGTRINKRFIRLHNFLMGAWSGHIDHKDGNCLNNKRANLRKCSHMDNLHNIGKSKSNSSGYKGVWFAKGENKFKSQIRVNGKRECLGTFKTAIEAAEAYNARAMEYHGEFAKLNKI